MNDQKTQEPDAFLAEDLKRLAITALLTIGLLVILVIAQQRFSLFEYAAVNTPRTTTVEQNGAAVEFETSELPEVPEE